MVADLICVKHNDQSSLCLGQIPIRAGENGDARVAKRVGQIIGQAKHLQRLRLKLYVADRPALTEFCAELQSNRSIETLSLLLENPDVDVSPLVPFLRENATVTKLIFWNCSLQSATELSNVVLDRGKDALRSLHVYNSPLGDVDLNRQLALRNLRHLTLDECGIGKTACASLANLLSDPQSKLWGLSLKHNSIGDEGLSALVDSLAGNTVLTELNLGGNNEISKVGWSMLLELVCNSEDVARSNHHLYGLGFRVSATYRAVIDALGANDAHLLRASLAINREVWLEKEKHAAIKRKVILCHARGDLNVVQVCDSPVGEERAIDVGVLPRILAWFAGGSNAANANLIQYPDPQLPEAEIGALRLGSLHRILRERAIRLGSLHRILRERPEMFKNESGKAEAVAVAVAMAETPKDTPVATESMLAAEVNNGGANEAELKDGKRRVELGVKDGERSLAMSNKKQRVDPPSLSMSDIPLEYRMEESDESVATEEPDELDGSNQFALLHAACGRYGRVPGVIYARATGGQDDDAGDAVNL